VDPRLLLANRVLGTGLAVEIVDDQIGVFDHKQRILIAQNAGNSVDSYLLGAIARDEIGIDAAITLDLIDREGNLRCKGI
jgi:hypothetical protein